MQIQVLMFNQDDPSKCTAAKLVKFGLATKFKKSTTNNMILNPFAKDFVLNSDKNCIESITAIDCSWARAQETFVKKFMGLQRKLPPLLAGNPVNYSKIGKLTTAEAISGTLFILGYGDLASAVLNKFKWGHTFLELNDELLKDYCNAVTSEDVIKISQEYGLTTEGQIFGSK